MSAGAEVPPRWETKPLGDLFDVLDSRRVPVNARERGNRQGNIPYYGATGQVGWIDDFLFDEELVLLGEDGAPFLDGLKPKAYVIRGKTWVNKHAHVLRGLGGTPSAFWKYQLDQVQYRPFVSGTTRLKLPQSPMRAIPLRVPPLDEQRRIAESIDSYFTRLDAAKATLERVKRNLERYRASVLQAAVEGRLVPAEAELARMKGRAYQSATEWLVSAKHPAKDARLESNGQVASQTQRGRHPLPEGWCWVNLGRLVEVVRGASPRPKGDPRYFGGRIPWITIRDVTSAPGRYLRATREGVTKAGAELSRHLPAGTLILTNSATVCVPKFLGVSGCIHDGFVAFLDPLPDLNLVYMYEYFNWVRPRMIDENRQGMTQVNLNTDIVRSMMVPLPPPKEQDRIADELDVQLELVDSQEAVIEESLSRCKKLRESILALAFSGGLTDQNITDEPASELLDRIRAERAKVVSSLDAPRRRGRPRKAVKK